MDTTPISSRNNVTTDFGRLAGIAGLISAAMIALSIVMTFASGVPPALDEQADKVLKYYKENADMVKFGALLGFLTLVTVPIWFLGVYSALRDRATAATDSWPRLALVALIVAGSVIAVQGAVVLALALGAKDEFDQAPAVAGALFDLYNALSAAIAVTFGLLMLATGVAIDRAGGYPKWWSTVLYVGGVASFVSFLAPFLAVDALAFVALIAIIAFIVFVAASSMAMMRSHTTAPRSPAL